MTNETTGRFDEVMGLARAHGMTLGEVLRTRATSPGDAGRIAMRFVDYSVDRNGVESALTFAELDAAVTATAARLSEHAGRGDRVAVLAPQGLDYVVGFLGALRAGLIAVPLFQPDLPGHGDRLASVLADCVPTVALATTANRALVEETVRASAGAGTPATVLAIDEPFEAGAWTPPAVGPDDVAYLQYTSGSTRAPVGVRITHHNIVVNAAQALVAGNGTTDSTLVSWLPLFHDMGLVFVVGGSLVGGIPSVLMDPIAFLMKPLRWLQHLAASPGAFTAAPNFAFDFCATRISEADRSTLDLSSVNAMFNGAEPIQRSTLVRFQEVFGPQGLRPGAVAPSYGLAEATVYVCGMSTGFEGTSRTFDLEALSQGKAVEVDEGDATVTLVACGAPVGQHVAIADSESGRRAPEGTVGEIWVHGPNVGDGYWGRPDLSEAVFGRTLVDAGDLPEGPWLSSGDLGVMYDGMLFVTGRIKDLVIVDGRNHYPQDLEHTVENAHDVIGRHRTAAFSFDGGSGEQAVVVAEVSRHHVDGDWDRAEVVRSIRNAVSRQHGVSLHDVVLIRPDTVPRTTSGKIARQATRTAWTDATLALIGGS